MGRSKSGQYFGHAGYTLTFQLRKFGRILKMQVQITQAGREEYAYQTIQRNGGRLLFRQEWKYRPPLLDSTDRVIKIWKIAIRSEEMQLGQYFRRGGNIANIPLRKLGRIWNNWFRYLKPPYRNTCRRLFREMVGEFAPLKSGGAVRPLSDSATMVIGLCIMGGCRG